MAFALLALAQVVGLLLVPLGLPGTWLQVAAIGVFAYVTRWGASGWTVFGVALLLAIVAEVIEFVLGGRFARKYGGSRRAGWGAILGGLIGAFVGIPIPVIGSVIGAFIGAFVGAAVLEMTKNPEMRGAMRVGWGAFLGRLAAVAMKSAVSIVIGVIAVFAALAMGAMAG
ncbi:DUF456 domain-containing protein [Longimicrobium sp.]|uniref:DUF456 domain-containing protein n=1 Tax=Longimicrobium sp. TaxID=2029185 RepID=UPI002B6BBFB4|nr:DUF456 domain-containing protein [Longimicrobium sp.]HSU12635.1 DUF456 domain-containing protein [Longimicrobium sp.]